MVDIVKIKDSISGLVGYKQPTNPDYAIVNSSNLESESGYYVNSNPYAKIEFIKSTQDDASISDADFNTFLSDIIKDSAVNVINQVFNKPDFIDRNLVFRYPQNKKDVDVLPNGFIGFRIAIDDAKSVGFKITRVLLDFKGTGNLRLLLFNSAKNTVLQTKDIAISSDRQEEVLNWTLNDVDAIYKGEYFIGYIKDDDFTLQPYKRNYEASNIMSYISHLEIGEVIVDDHATETIFDLSKVEYLNESSGLNLDITVYDDFTDVILQNKFLFARAIQLSAIIQCLKIYMASLRSNRHERDADEKYRKVLTEIEGTRGEDNVISVKGLRPQLIGEISDIKAEIEKLREGYLGNGYEVITER